jgi:putative drug exporter of the RND superfamily
VVVLVLGVLLRAVLAPLLLLGCTLLSAGAALGVSTLLFRTLGFPRTDQSVLTLGFLFLVALGVDYTIFLMARAREEISRRGHQSGLLHALTATGGVITSAGVVLAATFLVLTITPVVLNIQLGLLVASGVLIDAFIVRAALVPAAAIDAGRRIWWPSRLSRAAEARPDRQTPPTAPDRAPATSPSPG